MKFDFSGYASAYNVKCTDGRTIQPDAFKHQDGAKIPLVWQHLHDAPENVIGHAYLEHREDGPYVYCIFNESTAGVNAKELVKHKDIDKLSIYANQLQEQNKLVTHGVIREVSLVMAAANPGAKIDNVMYHSDGGTPKEAPGEVVIYSGKDISLTEVEYELKHNDTPPANKNQTMREIVDSMTPQQKEVMYSMLASVAGDRDMQHDNGGGNHVKHNVFDKGTHTQTNQQKLDPAEVKAIMHDAMSGGSLRTAILSHATSHGIENIDVLFPDAKAVMNTPEILSRRMEWVKVVLNGITPKPFSKIKSRYADLTEDRARAKGYITGNEKWESVFKLAQRETGPTTIYVKNKLDKDDIDDITDLDVVAFMKGEMTVMLDEERARAYLVGDGRDITDPDKVDEDKIRPIYSDEDLYAIKKRIPAEQSGLDELEGILMAMTDYRGSGRPALFTTLAKATEWRLLKNGNDDYRFKSIEDVAGFLGVSGIYDVEAFEGISREVDGKTYDLTAIIVNLRDYASGAKRGGTQNMFEDFDIDFNQYKYLRETRCSGALTKLKSAIVVEKEQAAG